MFEKLKKLLEKSKSSKWSLFVLNKILGFTIPFNKPHGVKVYKVDDKLAREIGQWYKMEIVCKGDEISCILNDQLLYKLENLTHSSGKIKMVLWKKLFFLKKFDFTCHKNLLLTKIFTMFFIILNIDSPGSYLSFVKFKMFLRSQN